MNKYAYDAIKVQVTDHFAGLEEGEDGDFEILKNNLLEMFE